MYGQHDNKEDFEGPAFRALGAFPDYAEAFQTNDDGFKNFSGENSLEPIAWRSTSDGFGGGMFEMGGWAGLPQQHEEMSLNPKFDAPQFGGHKELYHPQGWGGHQATQSKTMGLSSSSLSSSLEPPHAPGGYIEPHWHFVSSTPCALLFQTLQAWLEHNEIDYVVKPTKFACKCVVYRNGSKLPFTIRIFATHTRKQYAVEFNRRSGDTIAFGELYRKAKAELAEDGHVMGFQPTTPAILPDLPPLELEAPAASAMNDTVNCLLAMATCGAVDLQEQALAALSDITADVNRCPFGAFPPHATDLLVQALQSQSQDMNRCALTCLANLVLSGHMEMCQRLAEQHVIATLLTLTNAESAQVARESARTLANMAEIMKAPMMEYEPRLRTELPALERSPDVRIRGYAAALQRIAV